MALIEREVSALISALRAIAFLSESDLDQYKGFEPSQPAWKAGMLAVKHQYWIRCTKHL